MINKKKLWLLYIIIFLIILIITSIIAFCIGSVAIPFNKIISIIKSDHHSPEFLVLFNRFCRIIFAFGIGSALSLSGTLMQGMFRNPLVEPYTLGISGGAALGVSLNIVFKIYEIAGNITMPLFGFIGALAAIAILYFLSYNRGKIKIQDMLLVGVMVSFISSSIIMLIMAMSKSEDLQGIVYWTMGSLDESNPLFIALAPIISITALIITIFFSIDLNALSIGENDAYHLGISVEKLKILIFILTSILTGFSVSVAGVIGFVGLIVPHFVRMLVGNDYRIMLVCSFLGGAAFLIFCDTIARVIISPLELPVGVITGIIGGTIFIYTLNKKRSSL